MAPTEDTNRGTEIDELGTDAVRRDPDGTRVTETTAEAGAWQDTVTVHPDGERVSRAKKPAPDFREGDKIDRFLVLGRLGSGAMGQVHEAYDPQLHRRIAIKLLHGKAAEHNAQAMMMREAQALARLSHPNVIQIYEVGTIEDKVFLAMEHVDGSDLREWLKDESRDWRATVEIFLQAGRGLAAAHEADLIHRDFKPANVLLDRKGRARVVDFGLARAAQMLPVEEESGDLELESDSVNTESSATETGAGTGSAISISGAPGGSVGPSALESPLTQAGATMGTPLFMAPEQHFGVADARSDQFAFCVSLYRALYDRYPFRHRGVRGPAKQPPPSGKRRRKVPEWLTPVVMRGLATDPRDRYPTMEALLVELNRQPVRRSIGVLSAAGIAAAAVVASLVIVALRDDPSTVCRGAAPALASVWNAQMSSAMRTAFAGTGRTYAEETHERVAVVLDRYGRAWVDANTEACEATHLHGVQSGALLDLRMACYSERLAQVKALLRVFTEKPDSAVIDRAVQAASSLAPLDRCADTAALREEVAEPDDPAVRAQIATARARVREAAALEQAGQYARGLTVIEEAHEQSEAIGFDPLRAETLFVRARLEIGAGNGEAAEASLEAAGDLAAKAGMDELLARVANELIVVLADLRALREAALEAGRHARFLATRARAGTLLSARITTNVGHAMFRGGELAGAEKHFRQALMLLEETLGSDHLEVALVVDQLGGVTSRNGRYAEAEALFRRAIAIAEKSLGPNHPRVAKLLNNLAIPVANQERLAEARDYLERALAIKERGLGLDHPSLAYSHLAMGKLLTRQADWKAARVHFERTVAIVEAKLGPTHFLLPVALTGLSYALIELGLAAEAILAQERAIAILKSAHSEATDLAFAQFALARALVAAGRERARARNLALRAWNGFRDAGATYEDERADLKSWMAEHGLGRPK